MLLKAHLLRWLLRARSSRTTQVRSGRASAACLVSGTFISILLLTVSLEARTILNGQNFKLDLSGYYKNLVFQSKRQTTNDPFVANLNRLRLEWDAKAGEHFSAKVVWDNELIGGDYLEAEEFAARQANRNAHYPDLEYEIARTNRIFYGQSFYRAFLQWKSDHVTTTVGRQRIDWGVMRLNPISDLFTRPPIFDVEKDESIVPVAAQSAILIGESWKVNPVYTLEADFDRSRTGLRVTKTLWRFDLSTFGGRFLRDTIAGFDFEGDVEQVGIRGEFLHDWTGAGPNFFQATVGADYGFANSLYLALEYFFNGQGTNDRTTALPFPNTAPFLQTVYENFIGFEAKYDLTPLWHLLFVSQTDPMGGSLLLNPETSYSLFSWMDLMLGTILPVGEGGGEFTAVPNLYYLKAQLFF